MPGAPISERKLLFLIGAVQFVNVLDFMMVMPLGPDLARALDISTAQLGVVGGSYTAAAALAGLVGARFLDRFDRRRALAVSLFGLMLATAAGGLALGLVSLVAARVVAGAFGGPATALALAIIGDVVPPERRGRALGAVMGAFAVASVLGVPAGLELARLGGFRLPFFAVAGAGALVATGALVLMPPLTGHLRQAALTPAGTGRLLAQPTVVCALLAAGTAMMANFALIPNLSAYWLFNLGYPRERLGLLYLVGGAVSFAAMRLAGWLVDRAGAAVVATGGTALYVAVLACGFILPAAWLPVMALFVGFMLTGTFRLVPLQTLATRVPGPGERARFLSIQTVVQHLSAASGAMLAARMLGELPGGRLVGMDRVAWFSVGAGCALPPLLWFVEVQVRRRERSRAAGEALRVPA